MSVTDVLEAVEQHTDQSEEELIDDLYIAVKDALRQGAARTATRAALSDAYDTFKRRGLRKERRAVGFVLAYLDGDCSPVAAL